MNKEEWLLIRERANHRDLTAVNQAFSHYCKVKNLNPNPREINKIQQLLSVDALIKWVDVNLKVTIVTDKKGFAIKIF